MVSEWELRTEMRRGHGSGVDVHSEQTRPGADANITHSDGDDFAVVDGALIVYADNRSVLALAPGSWRTARRCAGGESGCKANYVSVFAPVWTRADGDAIP